MRRYLPWLFLVAAVCGLVGTLTARHVNWWFAASRFAHVLISITYLLPHHRHW
jgi:hypothetical protein